MIILALDLGQTTGWAVGDTEQGPAVGSLKLPKAGDALGSYLIRYDVFLTDMIETQEPEIVLFETPLLSSPGFMARYKPAALAAMTEYRCCTEEVECASVYHSTAKKGFTGRGNATKDEMIDSARARNWSVANHDEADALAIWLYGVYLYDKLSMPFYDEDFSFTDAP